jgi:tryptophan synthase alpha subunit
VADGLIVGSAVVRRIAAASGNGTPREAVLADVGKYVSELLGALNP